MNSYECTIIDIGALFYTDFVKHAVLCFQFMKSGSTIQNVVSTIQLILLCQYLIS